MLAGMTTSVNGRHCFGSDLLNINLLQLWGDPILPDLGLFATH